MPVNLLPIVEREWPAHLPPPGAQMRVDAMRRSGLNPDGTRIKRRREYDPEVRREWWRKYDRAHASERNAANLARYYANREERLAKQREIDAKRRAKA